MRADAEHAVRTLARGSQFWPTALGLVAVTHVLADETSEADDLFADVVEVGVALEAPEPAVVALGERAVLAIGRSEWVQAEEFLDRALLLIRLSRMEEYPTSAFVYALAGRAALHRRDAPRAHELLAKAQRLRPRLTYALPYFAIQTRLEMARAYLTLADAGGARTMLREVDAVLRRQPDVGVLVLQADELRASLTAIRAQAPGASTLTAAELRLLPYLSTHLTFREIGERLYVSYHTVKSQAMAVYRKLSVTSRDGAVERARSLGLL